MRAPRVGVWVPLPDPRASWELRTVTGSPPDPGRGRLPEVTKTDAAVLTLRGLAGPRDCSPGSAVAPGGGGDARRHGASSRDKPVARGCPRGQS